MNQIQPSILAASCCSGPGATERPERKSAPAWKDEEPDAVALEVQTRMAEAAAIKTSRVQANTLRARTGHVAMGTMRLRTSFALRYGTVLGDKDTAIARRGGVRCGRRSTRRIGRSCWRRRRSVGAGLPSVVPRDRALEPAGQPGGPRATRGARASVRGARGTAQRGGGVWGGRGAGVGVGEDLWAVMFGLAAERRGDGESDLRPWCGSSVGRALERRVPLLANSKEVERLEGLKSELVAYRLAFGQPRQQELVSAGLGRAEVEAGDVDGWVF